MASSKNKKVSGTRVPARAGAAAAGAPTDARLERLRQLVTILEQSTLGELSYEDEDLAVTLRRGGAVEAAKHVTTRPTQAPAHEPAGHAATSRPEPNPADQHSIHVIRSPFVGTFYRAASPDSPAFTDVGQKVRRAQVVCIIEAMKLMNEIESEIEGTIVDVLVENGKSVQYGDALFRVRPNA